MTESKTNYSVPEPPPISNNNLSDIQQLICDHCEMIKEMLLEKNRKYGNSAIEPKRIFSKADPIEQINVRIDDKLSRIQSGQIDEDEDPEFDLIGYLILKRVAKEWQDLLLKKQRLDAVLKPFSLSPGITKEPPPPSPKPKATQSIH